MFRTRNVRKQRVSAKRTRSLVVCLFSFSSNLTFSSLLLSLSLYGNNERTGSWVKFPKYSPDRWEIRRQLYIPQTWYVKQLNEQPGRRILLGEFSSWRSPATSFHSWYFLFAYNRANEHGCNDNLRLQRAAREWSFDETSGRAPSYSNFNFAEISTQASSSLSSTRWNENPSPPPSSGWPWLLPFFVISIRLNATPERFEILGGRTKYLPPSSRIQLAGHRRTSLYPRGGKGKGNLTSCLGAGK